MPTVDPEDLASLVISTLDAAVKAPTEERKVRFREAMLRAMRRLDDHEPFVWRVFVADPHAQHRPVLHESSRSTARSEVRRAVEVLKVASSTLLAPHLDLLLSWKYDVGTRVYGAASIARESHAAHDLATALATYDLATSQHELALAAYDRATSQEQLALLQVKGVDGDEDEESVYADLALSLLRDTSLLVQETQRRSESISALLKEGL